MMELLNFSDVVKDLKEVDDFKYCKYYCIVSYFIVRCFVLKEKIMMLVRDGKIIIDVNDMVEVNYVSVKIDYKKGLM